MSTLSQTTPYHSADGSMHVLMGERLVFMMARDVNIKARNMVHTGMQAKLRKLSRHSYK